MTQVKAEPDAAERRRLAALAETELLDSERELEFDQLIELAASICGTPISLFSLVDADRQWFKASLGIEMRETPRNVSFCAHAIEQHDLFVIEDATDDPRFKDNPLVTGGPGIRFYAGVPLAGPDGSMLGTLCVADVVPRRLTEGQKTALEILALQVKARMDLRQQRRHLYASLARQEELLSELGASDRRFRLFMDNAPLLSFMKDEQGHFVFYNEKLSTRFGIDREAWLGKGDMDIWPGEIGEAIRKTDLEILADGEARESIEKTIDDAGRLVFWRSYKFRCRNVDGKPLLGGFAVDVTVEIARQQALETSNLELEELAARDGLTGLSNRRTLDQRLQQEFERARREQQPLSVLLIDLDNFKRRNDEFGHASGDEVLRRLGMLLHRTMRTHDIGARYGGEELVVVLPGVDTEGAERFAARVQAAMLSEAWPDGGVTASIGIATMQAGVSDGLMLVSLADQAMYAAKRAGKNRTMVYQGL